MTTKKYFELIPIAEKIRLDLFGKVKSHHEFAEAFNIRHRIIKVLNEND